MVENVSKSFATVVVNTVTDPAVLLSTGGSMVISEDSPIAAAINLSTVLISASVRAVNELQKEGFPINTYDSLDFMFANKGGSQITAGGIKTLASIDASRIIDFSRPETLFNFGAMAGSALANLSRGFSFYTEKEGTLKKCLDITGITAPALIYTFANPEAPEVLVAGYATSALMAIDRSLKDNQSRLPELVMAGTLCTSALMSSDPYVITASALWSAGFISQDMLRSNGGVFEGVENIARKVRGGFSGAAESLKNISADYMLYALNSCVEPGYAAHPEIPQVLMKIDDTIELS